MFLRSVVISFFYLPKTIDVIVREQSNTCNGFLQFTIGTYFEFRPL